MEAGPRMGISYIPLYCGYPTLRISALGSKLSFEKKSKSSDWRCPNLRAKAVPPYWTKWLGVSTNSIQSFRWDSGKISILGSNKLTSVLARVVLSPLAINL